MRKRIDVHETAEDSCKCITTVTQLDRIVRWRIERDTRAGVQYLSPWSPVEICSTFASSIKGNDGCDWCLLLPPWPFTHKDYFPLFSESILTIFVLLVQLQSTSLNHEVCVVKQHKKEWKISFKLCKKSHYYSKKIKKIEREREKSCINEWSFNEKYCTISLWIQRRFFKGRPLWFLYRDQRRMTQKSLAHFAVVGSKFALSPSSWNNTS